MHYMPMKFPSQYYASPPYFDVKIEGMVDEDIEILIASKIALASVLLSAATSFEESLIELDAICLSDRFDREKKKIKDAPYDGFEEETSILHYGTSFLLPFLIKMTTYLVDPIKRTERSNLMLSINSIAIILIFTYYNEEIFGLVLVITFLITDKFSATSHCNNNIIGLAAVQPAQEWFNFSEDLVAVGVNTEHYLIVGLLTNLIDIALANNHNNNLVVGTMCAIVTRWQSDVTCIFV
ncbi:hypothetical protein ACJX0J_008636, partial [Zea mays]